MDRRRLLYRAVQQRVLLQLDGILVRGHQQGNPISPIKYIDEINSVSLLPAYWHSWTNRCRSQRCSGSG